MAKTCAVCGQKIGIGNNVKIIDGNICRYCSSLSSAYMTQNVAKMKEYYKIRCERYHKFKATHILKNLGTETVNIDDNNKLINMYNDWFSYDEVVGYGFQATQTKVVTEKKGGITRAIVGNAVAGPVGAIVGSNTAKSVSRTVSGPQMLIIDLCTYSGNKRFGMMYPPKGFVEFLNNCITQNQQNEERRTLNNGNTNTDITEEIKKYKELLDMGAITQQEYDKKKQELLN